MRETRDLMVCEHFDKIPFSIYFCMLWFVLLMYVYASKWVNVCVVLSSHLIQCRFFTVIVKTWTYFHLNAGFGFVLIAFSICSMFTCQWIFGMSFCKCSYWISPFENILTSDHITNLCSIVLILMHMNLSRCRVWIPLLIACGFHPQSYVDSTFGPKWISTKI